MMSSGTTREGEHSSQYNPSTTTGTGETGSSGELDLETGIADMSSAKDEEEEEDITLFVRELLDQMQSRFQEMEDTLEDKMGEFGMRMDDLEQSLNELMEQAGLDPPEDPSEQGHHGGVNTSKDTV